MSKLPAQSVKFLRSGEIAQRAGVSAKALRLYQQRKLLAPSSHSPAGYGLYGPDDLRRLMQVVLLRNSGFKLAEIARLLTRDPRSGARLLNERIAALEHELTTKAQTLNALRFAARRVGSASNLDLEQLLESIAMTQTLDVKFTPAERAAFRDRAESLGSEAMAEAQQAWPLLIAEVRAAMTADTAPTDPTVLELGRRWHALVMAATGGDPGITRKLSEAYVEHPNAMAAQGMDMEMFRYIGQAMGAQGLKLAG